ncbi:MAG: DUF4402 domain-containing protein, partial [Flavobacteriaceae bacterium]|nr:DUF4402 domain-containing protein [Flavobacteriaceae bacterium]
DLSFGSFYLLGATGGSLSISNTGIRTTTGNIQEVNSSFLVSAFTLSTDSLNPINITVTSSLATLSNGVGNSMSLEAGISNPSNPVVQSGAPVQIFIGGTITVANEIPAGDYNGELFITFSIMIE